MLHNHCRAFAVRALALLVVLGLTATLAGPATAEDYRDTEHTEVSFTPASTGKYIGSPSLVVLANGDYLASHAYFGPGSTGNTTQVFRSQNEGVTWEAVEGTPVEPMMWATIFELDGSVFLMGTTRDTYGDAVIRRSTDNGQTWSEPVPLLRGAYHTGDTPVLVHDGRIYKTYEENLRPPGWAPNFRPLMISADIGDDLTDPVSWTRTNNVDKGSVLEGNPIVGPDGMIWNLLRYNDSRKEAWLTKLDPANPDELVDVGPVDFPRGVAFSKFFILWDEPSQRYLLVGNAETSNTGAITQRNHLDLYESSDLTDWRHVRTLIEDDSTESWAESVRLTSFSQPTAQIDGDDLLVVSRTAYDGARNYHDANRLSFHRYDDFRRHLDADDELAHYSFDSTQRPGADVSKASDHDADLTETAELVAGKVGQGVRITGSGSFVDLGNRIHPLLDGRRAATVSAWIKPDSLPEGALAAIFGSRIDNGGAGIDLLMNGSTVQLGGRSVSSDPYQMRNFDYPDDDEWHHLTAVWDFTGDDLRLFIDGEPQTGAGTVDFSSETYEVGNPGQPDRIGVTPNGSSAFPGVIDEVRIFGTAADTKRAERLAGTQRMPQLDMLEVNGDPVDGFNPDVHHHYDVVVRNGTSARLVADGARGSGVRQPRRTLPITDQPSEGEQFVVRHRKETATYTVTVRRQSADTSLAGVDVATGGWRSFAPGVEDYTVEVEESDEVALDLTIEDAKAIRAADGAKAEVVSQPDPNDEHPRGVVKVKAENGATELHDIAFEVQRQLVSAEADSAAGDAPFTVDFVANPTRWVQGDAEYVWDFGDGSSGAGREVSHTYEDVGTFTATVELTDETGKTDDAAVTVRVRPADRLAGRWLFDDPDPNVVADESLYGNDGTILGGDRVTGHDGEGAAVRFSGSGGVTLNEEMGPALNGAPAITISGWIKPQDTPAPEVIDHWVFGTRISGGAAGAELYMRGDTLRVGGRSKASDPYVSSDFGFVADGEWHHVAAVLDYEGKEIRLYIDGERQESTVSSGAFGEDAYQYGQTPQPDSIGRSPDGAYRFTGDLDDLAVHARSLSPDEISATVGASDD